MAGKRKCHLSLPRAGRGTPALVGIVPRKRDWERVQAAHWYRIPRRTAPEGIERVRYLAFYLGSQFGAERWAVTWYARVKGMATATRRELLPDEPEHPRADEQYYRIDVGDLKRLPRAIPSRRWRRIVFIPTTLERLMHAEEINDLFRTSPIEDRLYDALRREGLTPEREYLVRESGRGYMLDLALLCRDGKLDIECDGARYHFSPRKAEEDRSRDNDLTVDGWRILRFSGAEINRDTMKCIRLVRRTVRRLGGQEPVRD